jgi:hypothetical protein
MPRIKKWQPKRCRFSERRGNYGIQHKKYKDTKHPWPTANLGYGYRGAMFLFEAIKKAKSFDAEPS